MESSSTGRTEMVAQQPKTEKRETYPTPEHGHNNSARCGKTRMWGAHYQGLSARGQWNKEKGNFT